MPELPEVETARRLADHVLRGRRIIEVHTHADPLVYEGASNRKFASTLRGAKVCGTGRKGKHFWLELDRRPWPVFHLGMSGRWFAYSHSAERPDYWKLELVTDRGRRVAMVNKRRLGRIRLRHDPRLEHPVSRLGFDALTEIPTAQALHERLRARSAPLKSILLDQSFAAGIGNWIADELLYQSHISPHRRGTELTLSEVQTLRRVWKRVIELAVRVSSDHRHFPPSWLFHRRWGRDENARTPQGQALVFDTIGGRTTAWVPAVQS